MKPTISRIFMMLALSLSSARAGIILSSDGLGPSPASGAFGTSGAIHEFRIAADPGLAFVSFRNAGAGFLHLSYEFTALNILTSGRAAVFLDAEIDEGGGSWFNERGEALIAPGGAASWEIDEPGYVFGDIFDNYLAGGFDNSTFNGSPSLVEDVSLGLGFIFGDLQAGDQLTWELMISETQIAGPWGTVLHQWDVDAGPSGDHLYLAGRSRIVPAVPAAIPEPSIWVLFSVGLGFLVLLGRKSHFKQSA